MKSVMSHQFSQVPDVKIPRSSFNRSHGMKSTFDAGYLIPVLCDEALPGDTFNCSMTAFSRMSTPTFPVMDNLYMDTFFFAVPIRLVWDNFKKFMGEQSNPGDSTTYLVPVQDITAPPLSTTGHTVSSLSDYMGIPTDVPALEHSALFHRAYNLIFNEWFRDQNMQNSVVVDTDDGPDDPADYIPLRRGKRHDYFTSCLPWPQKGDSVELPLGTKAPIATDAAQASDISIGIGANWLEFTANSTLQYGSTASTETQELYADLSTATAATINQLRQSFQIQKLLERDARGGTRYTEIVKSHFGVTSPDARLQRPEYLGGGSTPVNVTPVAQTGGNIGLGGASDVNAYATTAIKGNGFTKSFTEHSLIIGLVSARADLTYQQGLNRMFSRQTRYDYFWPTLAQIGEQAVLNKEIYAQGSASPTDDAATFGYQERYAEYRYKPSIITGKFRSTYQTPLDAWHLSQEFTSLPELNDAFIAEDPPIDRVINTPAEPHFIWDSYFNLKCVRPMPMYGVPGMIDHF